MNPLAIAFIYLRCVTWEILHGAAFSRRALLCTKSLSHAPCTNTCEVGHLGERCWAHLLYVCAWAGACVRACVRPALCLCTFVYRVLSFCVAPSLLRWKSRRDTGCKSLSSNLIAGPEICRTYCHVCIHMGRRRTGLAACGDVIKLVIT